MLLRAIKDWETERATEDHSCCERRIDCKDIYYRSLVLQIKKCAVEGDVTVNGRVKAQKWNRNDQCHFWRHGNKQKKGKSDDHHKDHDDDPHQVEEEGGWRVRIDWWLLCLEEEDPVLEEEGGERRDTSETELKERRKWRAFVKKRTSPKKTTSSKVCISLVIMWHNLLLGHFHIFKSPFILDCQSV